MMFSLQDIEINAVLAILQIWKKYLKDFSWIGKEGCVGVSSIAKKKIYCRKEERGGLKEFDQKYCHR
jgi:hypothetical protein